MTDPQDNTPENLVQLDLSPFSKSDLAKIRDLAEKQKLLYRWFRSERVSRPGLDQFLLYSGTRGKNPYAAYRVERYRDGTYKLASQRTDELLATGRTLDEVLTELPDDFFYSV